MNLKMLGRLLPLLFVLLAFGCSSKTHTFKLTSQPTGAEVIFDGKTESNTPTAITVAKDGRDHYLFVGKEGCEEVRKVFRHNEYPQKLNLVLECDLADIAAGTGMDSGTDTFDDSSDTTDAVTPGSDGTVTIDGGDGRPMDRERFVNEDVYFAYDSSVLSGEAQANLQRKARWLQANPNIAIIIEGHTDERGTGAYNLALGDRRAQRVEAYFKDLGIAADRMLTVSFGEERPAVTGAGEEIWSRNRRAHTAIE